MSGHTPGPWERRANAIYPPGNEYVALIDDNVSHGDDTYVRLTDGDWHLIAAAPELLSMLKVAVAVTLDRWTRDVQRERQAGVEPREMPEWVLAAEALIAKAEGKS